MIFFFLAKKEPKLFSLHPNKIYNTNSNFNWGTNKINISIPTVYEMFYLKGFHEK